MRGGLGGGGWGRESPFKSKHKENLVKEVSPLHIPECDENGVGAMREKESST